MKIAFGTDDKLNITKRQFGESLYYSIYEVLNGQVYSQQIRENPARKRSDVDKEYGCLEALEDCDIFIGRDMEGLPLAELSGRNVEIIISSLDDIDRAISSFLNSEENYFRYYNPRMKKFTEYSAILKI
ncbi:hypothetical protein GF337_19905 [candidate division KSB1 bacterium]|nr:hypothetical protein [candidate division KSB1 bacterium]